jgi:ABC-type tungstate transport system substrate-binding protein
MPSDLSAIDMIVSADPALVAIVRLSLIVSLTAPLLVFRSERSLP